MKFDQLLLAVGRLPWFDLNTVAQLTDEPHRDLVNQISRWLREGKLISLRRGVYALAEHFRKASISMPTLANALYAPSYLSGLWALAFHGIIPEMVITYTSVTTRVTRRFENSLGTFFYSHIKSDLFHGFQHYRIDGVDALIARPEKAILDHWYLTPGEWTLERLDQMRYQLDEDFPVKDFLDAAGRFESPRIRNATANFRDWMEGQLSGSVIR